MDDHLAVRRPEVVRRSDLNYLTAEAGELPQRRSGAMRGHRITPCPLERSEEPPLPGLRNPCHPVHTRQKLIPTAARDASPDRRR